jgi:para-aminobenzoate synthetase component 1
VGRWSLFASEPRFVFEARGTRWTLSDSFAGIRPVDSDRPLAALDFLVDQTGCAVDLDHAGLPFTGGWIGHVSYDLAPQFERLPRRHGLASDDPRQAPDLHFGWYDTFALHEPSTGRTALSASDWLQEGEDAVRARLKRFHDGIVTAAPILDPPGPLVAGAPVSDFTRLEYLDAVERALEYIRAGDIFQVNLTHRFTAEFTGSIERLYLRVVERSPAPFAALIRGDGWAAVSNSPERFLLREESGRLETRPIKGTRARGFHGLDDLYQRVDLADSAKDRAELNMIVDLERNDLGRVARFGSVRVAEHARVESFSNVHHLVSVIEGTVRPGVGLESLLAATFPGGSITGAPKIRAMEIIDELERVPRGVYTGAIGYLSDGGRADFNIAIRTAIVTGGRVSYHVGGGIVADSDPEKEWEETLIKGRRLRGVLLDER